MNVDGSEDEEVGDGVILCQIHFSANKGADVILIGELVHKPEDYRGQPITVEGFLVSDGVNLWLTEKTENWGNKKRSVKVGDICLAKDILEEAPDFTMCGSALLATESRIAGVLSPSTGTYLLSFARVDGVSLKEDDGNWLSLDVHWPSETQLPDGGAVSLGR